MRTSHNGAPSFDTTLSEATRSMPVPQRIFSTFIHSEMIELISDAIGGTLARPNALFLGAAFSFVVTLVTYLFAKNLGYTMSGSESIVAFVAGWTLGLVYDLLKLMITGKH